ncbi:hypothetical protein PPL_12100 [Heterostelium album PN500]|uniref:Protein kinase domain-containing protein n=1 Tax=Heterostelium pallidum (strain ATCC 26659 / Pp 5 / PN500) TaxID=670386 RepID=D3BLP7_HETP5|nr:hypothetical protein PPL_12100 [Heterostelium album PN500]EFA77498.1 hypothetical protein PPL_12100 [Heterostelium album PN500]|eukprot:XP_020429626.1 hypothetical protein PPL_12100 [Heterostelium album PN500]
MEIKDIEIEIEESKKVLEISFQYFFGKLTILIYNHLREKENEQLRNIKLIGGIDQIENKIIVPKTVDDQYKLIILRYCRYFSTKTNKISISTKILNKSESYKINLIESDFQEDINYFQQTQVINNKRYHLISRFTNSNAINDVYLVGGTDDQRLINYKDNQKSYESAENEIKAMKLFKGNQRFVQLVDYQEDKGNQIFHIITEYCFDGDLSHIIKRLTEQDRIIDELVLKKYISQLFNILLDLDKHGIVHCDIKPSNIFIHEFDYDFSLKLGDFGSCLFIDQLPVIEYINTKENNLDTRKEYNNTDISYPTIISNPYIRGTKGYISPEAMNKQYAHSCDIFSIGSTILKLLCCHQEDRNNHQLFQTNGEIKISECRYSKQLIELVNRLLDQRSKNRESLKCFLNKYIDAITNEYTITFNVDTDFNNTSKNITELYFGREFNQHLNRNSLPPNIITLSFGHYFNQPILIDVLPKSLKYLSFGYYFNQKLEIGVLPNSLLSLSFGDAFNQVLSVGELPVKLKSLFSGNGFNQILSVGVLPKSLLSLVLGDRFNLLLSKGVFPESLKSLKMMGYNLRIDRDVLPNNLENLYFGSFNQTLDIGTFSNQIRSLTFTKLRQPLDIGVLPQTLEDLRFGSEGQHISIGVLPSSLKRIMFFCHDNSKQSSNTNGIFELIPTSIESLIISGYNELEIKKRKFLKTLEIDLGGGHKYEASILTNSIESLKYIQEFYPVYFSSHYLELTSPLQGEYITALLVTLIKN